MTAPAAGGASGVDIYAMVSVDLLIKRLQLLQVRQRHLLDRRI